jgi:hypothetical protein
MRSLKIGRQIQLATALFAGAALALSFVSHAGAVTTTAKPGPPRVTTGNASRGHGGSNVLDGIVEPHGAATTYYFQYGPTSTYGLLTGAATLPAGFHKIKVALVAPSLVQGYHYRIVGTNAYGTKTGKDRVFSRKKGSEFVLPKALTPVVYSASFVFNGALTSASGGRQIVLQADPYPYHAGFTTVAGPVTTNAAGAFRFRLAHLTTSTEFRVATLEARPLISRPLIEKVTVRVTLKVRSRGPKGLVRVYGAIRPAVVGAKVFIQLSKAVHGGGGKSERSSRFATEFTTVAKRGTKTISRFSAVLTVSRTGNYRAFVEVRKGPVVSGESATIVLSAKPGASKHHTHRKRK